MRDYKAISWTAGRFSDLLTVSLGPPSMVLTLMSGFVLAIRARLLAGIAQRRR